jgi:hypothetical protein
VPGEGLNSPYVNRLKYLWYEGLKISNHCYLNYQYLILGTRFIFDLP